MPIIATLVVGRFELTLGRDDGALARPVERPEGQRPPPDLAEAIRAVAGDPGAPVPGAVAPEGTLADLDEVTEELEVRLERLRSQIGLLGEIAAGRIPRSVLLELEADAVAALVARLERDRRFQAVLRAARDATAIYLLLQRWVALVDGTRQALVAAQAVGDRVTEASSLDQLGTLAVAAEEPALARAWLTEALRLREQLGDVAGSAATERSLALVARRTSALTRVAQVAGACTALAVGGMVGYGIAGLYDDPPPAEAATPTTATVVVTEPLTITLPGPERTLTDTVLATVTERETLTETATRTETQTLTETRTFTETQTVTETLTTTVTEPPPTVE